jgi:protoheme IX farnesyltransferase
MASSQEECIVLEAPSELSIVDRARAFYELGKPNLSGLVVVTGILGFYLASPGFASIDWWRFLHLVAGTAMTAAGACAVNMYIERDLDAVMFRTRHRPIPSGRVSPREALIFAIAAFAVGFVELAIFCGAYPALLSLFTLLVYAFVYTPMKRKGPISIAIGAIPGAIPPVMGFATVRGELGLGGLALFAILFLWQFPHFLALAFMYRDDYARGGFRFLPEGAGAERKTGLAIAIGSALTIAASTLPVVLGLAGMIYLAGALLAGLAFLLPCVRAARKMTAGRARAAFIASVTYLPALLALMLLDRVLGS